MSLVKRDSKEGMEYLSIWEQDRYEIFLNRSWRSAWVVCWATQAAMRLAKMFVTKESSEATIMAPPHTRIRFKSRRGTMSSMRYDKIQGSSSSIIAPKNLTNIPRHILGAKGLM